MAGILDFFSFGKQRKDYEETISTLKREIADIKVTARRNEEAQKKLEEQIISRRRTLQKPIQYATPHTASHGTSRTTNSIYYGPLYNLGEIGRALDIEPYISISVRKHREQVLKEGYSISGSDPELVEYVNRRLFEMFLVSGITTEQWIREIATQLITYGTCLLVKKRDKKKSTGNNYRFHGKMIEPIAAVFPLDPTSVKVKLNLHGHPIKWLQEVEDPVGNKTSITFDATDILVGTIDKKSGFVFGTPYILPVLDDVRVLRRIEEMAEIIGQKHAFPLTHWRVGDDETGLPTAFDDGTTEVDIVREEVQNVPPEGGIVTSKHVEATTLGIADKVIDLVPYMGYFEKRVMGGLRLSPEDLGRAEGTKASAVTVSQSLQDSSKDFQAVLSDAITHQLLFELLLEGGGRITHENLVVLEFAMINREEERARQSHGGDMFNNGLITRSEFRKEFINKDELSEQECEDCLPEMKHKNDIELAKTNGAVRAANSAAKTSEAAKKKTSNTSRPQNQSGKKPTKTRVKANDTYKEFYSRSIIGLYSDLESTIQNFYEKHGSGVNHENEDKFDVTTKDEELKGILNVFVIHATKESRNLLSPVIDSGVKEALSDLEEENLYIMPKRSLDRFFKNSVQKSYKEITQDIYSQLNNSTVLAGLDNSRDKLLEVQAICGYFVDEVLLISKQNVDLAYRFAYSKVAKSYGIDTVHLEPIDKDDSLIEVSLDQKDIPYRHLFATPPEKTFDIIISPDRIKSKNK